ncbi:heavy-metal-associated domain-containing protein [Yinghuangia seranimata]|uniref:heavy-metal-associated domain-containing protein n=1 Tax=Yinghuangia seranimata TaxID=408067 RepID=UPI00248CBA23|nr:cation transporter [Yinghuangia seranimata]MDI2130155.1 cation transporter [Yinghuangia seranimata]
MTWLRRNKPAETGPQTVLLVDGTHCSSCGLLIDDELEDVPGVRSASTDVRTGRTVVRFATDPVNPELLVAAVERAGYRATTADSP